MALETQKTADQFADEMEHTAGVDSLIYVRLNVQRGLENIKLEEWKDFNALTGATNEYVNHHKADLEKCANALLDAGGGL